MAPGIGLSTDKAGEVKQRSKAIKHARADLFASLRGRLAAIQPAVVYKQLGAVDHVRACKLCVHFKYNGQIDWSAAPSAIDPAAGDLNVPRAHRKRMQLANLCGQACTCDNGV